MACKHPRVRVVSREEDTEFVECLECGDVFESSEFKDMEIEEQVAKADQVDRQADKDKEDQGEKKDRGKR